MTEIKEKIEMLIAKAQLENAIDELLIFTKNHQEYESISGKVVLLKAKSNEVKDQDVLGLIDFTEKLKMRTQISNAILNLLSQIDEILEVPRSDASLTEESKSPYKILFLASNPIDTGKLQLEKEFVGISRGLQDSGTNFNLVAEWAITPEILQMAILKHKPDIVHFSGHGDGGIILQDSSGKAHEVPEAALTSLFSILLTRCSTFKFQLTLQNAKVDFPKIYLKKYRQYEQATCE